MPKANWKNQLTAYSKAPPMRALTTKVISQCLL